MPRRLLVLIALLLLTLSASAYAALRAGALVYAHRSYNCLLVGDVSVQLNTHLEWNVPHVLSKSVSPDGKYSLQLWGTPTQQVIRLLHVPTGQVTRIHSLGNGEYTHPSYWTWSSDSRYVFYGWHAGRQTQAVLRDLKGEERAMTFTGQDLYAMPLTFSPGHKYFVVLEYDGLYRNQNLIFIVLSDFHARKVALPTPAVSYEVSARWSPDGKLLAYFDKGQALIIDPDTGRFGQVVLHHLAPQDWYALGIQWSPDQQYLLYFYDTPGSMQTMIAVMAIQDLTPILLETKAFQMADVRDHVYHWSSTGHTLFYLKQQATNPPPAPGQEVPRDLWQFDPATGFTSRVDRNILGGISTSYGLILVHQEPRSIMLEFRHWDGRTPIITRTFDDTSGTLHGLYACSRLNCDTLMYDLARTLPACPVQGFEPEQFSISEDGKIAWNFKLPPGAAVVSEPASLFSNNTAFAAQCRFTARILQQDDRRWVEIGDLFTGTFYRLPEALTGTLPPGFLDAPSPYWWWAFWIIPSPDDQTWMVYFEVSEGQGVIYLFRPDDQRWTLLYQDTDPLNPSIDKVTWSPDSQRMAYTRWVPGNPAPNLFVTTADGSRQWSLGYFPYARYEQITWDKCGGIETILRGD